MRSSIIAALVLFGTLSTNAQSAVELDTKMPSHFAYHSAAFTNDGEHLIVGVRGSLDVFESASGKLIHRVPLVSDIDDAGKPFVAPVEARVRHAAVPVELPYAKNLSITFGGKTLVLDVGSTVRLIDVQKLVSLGRLDEIKLKHRGGIFIDAFGPNGLAFLSKNARSRNTTSTDNISLKVYKLVKGKLNDVASVDLGAGLVTRWDQAVHTYHAPQLVLGRADQETGFVNAVRISPDAIPKTHTIFEMSRPTTCQAIKISWDENGYGKLAKGQESRLPFCPSSYDARLEKCVGPKYQPRNKKFFVDMIQHASLVDSSPQIQRIRVLAGEYNRYTGLELAQWAGGGNYFIVNDCHDTSSHRDTVVSVHDQGGQVVATLKTGKAHNAHAVAVSNDGRFVLTSACLTNRAASKSPSIAPSRRKKVLPRLQLWTTGL